MSPAPLFSIKRFIGRLACAFLSSAGQRWALGLFIVIFLIAATVRAWAAPFSATEDMAQFWSFAQLFKEHGLDFYRFYAGTDPINPIQGWGFVYPPVWLLFLGLGLLAVPAAMAGPTFVDTAWRIAEKAPIISADLVIGVLLFIAIPGSRWRKLVFAALWLLNPAAWYESAVFGQFDAIAAVFLLGSLILLERGRDRWAFVVAALAVLTKQHTLFALAFMVAAVARTMPWRRLAGNLAIFAGVVAVLSLPFIATGNIVEYARAVLFPGQAAYYQEPLLYSFSGGGALLTYLHNTNGWDTIGWMQLSILILLIAFIGGLILVYVQRVSPLRAMLIGILLFIALFYRINYQYLIIFMPLALLAAARTTYLSERLIGLSLDLFPAVWLWYFDVSFWFNFLSPYYPGAVSILERLGWTRETSADYVYVRIALAITALSLIYVIFALTRWKKPPRSPTIYPTT